MAELMASSVRYELVANSVQCSVRIQYELVANSVQCSVRIGGKSCSVRWWQVLFSGTVRLVNTNRVDCQINVQWYGTVGKQGRLSK
jgi:hypothetical protein